MRKDIEEKLQKEKHRRLREMPEVVADFILAKEEEKELRTLICYIKDLNIYFQFLLENPKMAHVKSISNFKVNDLKTLEEKDIINFLSFTTSYEKTFNRKDGKEFTQVFKNTKLGKARKLATLHTFYEWLGRNEELEIKDITKYVEVSVPIKKELKDKLDYFDIDEMIRVIEEDVNVESDRSLKFHQRVKFRDLTIFYMFAFTGIRVSELVQLDISDISLRDGSMIVIRKGGDQERIYIPEAIYPILEEYLERRKLIEGVEYLYKNALFLSSQMKRIETRTVRYMLEKYRKRAGISIKVTPHTIRRSFGHKLFNDTGDIQFTADTLGHKNPATTRKFYVEPSEERKKAILRKFSYKQSDTV